MKKLHEILKSFSLAARVPANSQWPSRANHPRNPTSTNSQPDAPLSYRVAYLRAHNPGPAKPKFEIQVRRASSGEGEERKAPVLPDNDFARRPRPAPTPLAPGPIDCRQFSATRGLAATITLPLGIAGTGGARHHPSPSRNHGCRAGTLRPPRPATGADCYGLRCRQCPAYREHPTPSMPTRHFPISDCNITASKNNPACTHLPPLEHLKSNLDPPLSRPSSPLSTMPSAATSATHNRQG